MNNQLVAGLRIGGKWFMECHDKNGKFLWREEIHNVWTHQGLNSLLDVYFHAATQITTWYCEIFESNTTPDANTTYAVPVYTPCTAYDEATRPAYTEAASSSQSITNSANKATFTMNASKTIYGAALVGGGSAATTKGDAAGGGTLCVAGKFGTAQPVIATNVLSLTYTVGAADDGA
jgi:hypothetical protein